MSTQVSVEEPETRYCARHPSVETVLRCGRCETPICPRCMVQTPVGGRCRTCSGVKRVVLVAKPRELLKAAALGFAVALVGGLLVRMIPFFVLLGLVFLGYLVGEAVSVGVNRKRGWEAATLAVVCLFVGFALSPLLALLLSGSVPPLGVLPRLFLGLLEPFVLLGLGVGALIAWMRLR